MSKQVSHKSWLIFPQNFQAINMMWLIWLWVLVLDCVIFWLVNNKKFMWSFKYLSQGDLSWHMIFSMIIHWPFHQSVDEPLMPRQQDNHLKKWTNYILKKIQTEKQHLITKSCS